MILLANLKELQELIDDEIRHHQLNSAIAHQQVLFERLGVLDALQHSTGSDKRTDQVDGRDAEGDSSSA